MILIFFTSSSCEHQKRYTKEETQTYFMLLVGIFYCTHKKRFLKGTNTISDDGTMSEENTKGKKARRDRSLKINFQDQHYGQGIKLKRRLVWRLNCCLRVEC